MPIGNLTVVLGLDFAPFIAGLKDAEREANAAEKAWKPLITATKELGEMMSVVGDVVVAGMVEMTVKSAEYGAELQHLHDKSGVSIEDLSALGFAATQNGSSLDGLGNSLKFLSKNLEIATTSGGAQLKAFEALGISEKDLVATHGSASAAFLLLSDHVTTAAFASAHAADMTKVLGKSWTEMVPVLELGRGGIQAFADEAARLGIVLNSETTEADLKFVQGMKEMKDALLGLSVAVGDALIPVLKPLIDDVTNGIVAAKDFAKAHKDLTVAIFDTAAVIGGAGGVLLGLAGIGLAYPMVVGGLGLMKDAAAALNLVLDANPVGATVAAFVALSAAAYYFRDTLAAGVIGLAQDAVAVFGALAEGAGTLATAMGMTKLGATLTDASKSILGTAASMADMRHSFLDSTDATNISAASINDFKKSHQAMAPTVNESQKALDEFNKGVDALTSKAIPSKAATGELAVAILDLMQAGIPAATITQDLGKQAFDMRQKYVDAGEQIPESFRWAIDSIANAFEVQKASTAGTKDLIDQEKQAREDASKLYTKLAYSDLDVINVVLQARARLDNEYESGRMASMEAGDYKLKSLTNAELDDQVIADQKKLKQDEKTYNDAFAKASEMGNKIQGEWNRNMDQMGKQTASAFADMILNWQFNADAMIKIADNTAKAMLTSFLQGLISPLTTKLASLGASITDTVLGIGPTKNAITGVAGTATTGGGIIGTAKEIGGFFGIGGTGAATGASASVDAAGVITDTTGAAAGGAGGGVVGTVGTIPLIGAAIGAAISIYEVTKQGQAHPLANDFVKFQEQFVNKSGTGYINQLVDQFGAAYASGVMTPETAQQFQDALIGAAAQFDKQADAFSAAGSLYPGAPNPNATIATQGRNTIDPFVAGIIGDMNVKIAALGQPKANVDAWYAQINAGMNPNSTGWNHNLDYLADILGHVPGFAGGIDPVPYDMFAQIHKGEAVITEPENRARHSGGGASGSILNFYFNLEGSSITDSDFRFKIIPLFKEAIGNNTDQLGEVAARSARNLIPGLST